MSQIEAPSLAPYRTKASQGRALLRAVASDGWLVPLAVLTLSLALRLWQIDSLPMFIDESNYLRWAHDIFEQRTRMSLLIPINDDGKQPLFMWLTAGVMGLVADPLIAGRTVSALAGVASTLGVYLLGCWLGGRRTGLVASLLYTLVPYTLFFDRMALQDGMVGTTAVYSLCLGVLICTRPGSKRHALIQGLGLGMVLGAAVWVKMTGLFVLPLPLFGLLLMRRPWRLLRIGMAMAVAYGVFVLLAVTLALMPDADNLVSKTGHFAFTPAEVAAFPVDRWKTNTVAFGSWLLAYLPGPLPWLVLMAALWGLAARRRETLLLLGCWASLSIPMILLGNDLFTSRYLMPSVFPLLLLAALLVSAAWECGLRVAKRLLLGTRARIVPPAAGLLLLLLMLAPSLAFDLQLLAEPSKAALVEFDRFQYVSGFPSGYGFREAVELIKRRVDEQSGEVIVLTDQFRALPRDGVVLYLQGLPHIHVYLDGHIPWGGKGIVEAWWSHQVPLFVIGNEGLDDLDSFERNVPEAQRIGFFPKPGGQSSFGQQSSFRVYLIDLQGIPAPTGR